MSKPTQILTILRGAIRHAYLCTNSLDHWVYFMYPSRPYFYMVNIDNRPLSNIRTAAPSSGTRPANGFRFGFHLARKKTPCPPRNSKDPKMRLPGKWIKRMTNKRTGFRDTCKFNTGSQFFLNTNVCVLRTSSSFTVKNTI